MAADPSWLVRGLVGFGMVHHVPPPPASEELHREEVARAEEHPIPRSSTTLLTGALDQPVGVSGAATDSSLPIRIPSRKHGQLCLLEHPATTEESNP